MKRHLLLTLLVTVICSLSFTSCIVDDPWWGNTPPGYDNFGYDSRLTGTWQLIQCDSRPVSYNETNYLQFYGNGSGGYYYLQNGFRRSESIEYYCYRSQNSTSNYEIDIHYQYSNPATMNYWFAEGRLFMQWRLSGSGQPVTYVYQKVAGPWN